MSINDQTAQAKFQVSNLETWINLFLGLIAATVTPTLLFSAIFLLSFVSDMVKQPEYIEGRLLIVFVAGCVALLTALFHVVILGIPLVIIAWYYKFIRLWTCLLAGFLLSCIPTAIIFSGMNHLTIEKIYSWAGGILIPALFMGFFGTVGGFAFWFVWQIRIHQARQNNNFEKA
jgi:hypothetical protein